MRLEYKQIPEVGSMDLGQRWRRCRRKMSTFAISSPDEFLSVHVICLCLTTMQYAIYFWFLQRAQCSHCKRCISYSNSVCLSVRLSVTRRVFSSVAVRFQLIFSERERHVHVRYMLSPVRLSVCHLSVCRL